MPKDGVLLGFEIGALNHTKRNKTTAQQRNSSPFQHISTKTLHQPHKPRPSSPATVDAHCQARQKHLAGTVNGFASARRSVENGSVGLLLRWGDVLENISNSLFT